MTALSERLARRRTDRPDEWEMDEFAGLAMKLEIQRDALLKICKEFVRRCDAGEIRSVRTYSEMIVAIAMCEVQ